MASTAARALERVVIEVFRAQRSGLWGYFSRGAADAAEDLLQETFLRVWGHRHELLEDRELDAPGAIQRYVWRVARNQMIDEIRLRQRRRSREQPIATDEASQAKTAADAGPAVYAEIEDCLRVLRQTVGTLRPHRMQRCLRRWLAGEPLAAIAAAEGLAPGQVRGLLQRGRSELLQRAGARLRAPAGEGRGRGEDRT